MSQTIDHASRVQVKLYEDGTKLDTEALIPVWHRWIAERRLQDETLVDVADYGHVKDGPGIALIGHGTDLFYDEGEGRPGLLLFRKRAFEGDLRARLRDAFERVLQAQTWLEAEDSLSVRFGRREVLVRILDRLHAPNDDAAFEALAPIVREVAEEVLGHAVEVSRAGTPKGPLSARVRRAADA
ncbi:MAG: hypothetical protein H6720_04305 [Sandaracinus sp.]|nr:hypothetical protein [Sandaracinus sp.]